MELYLFDDEMARAWSPFTETRPAGELRYGAWTFRERAQRFAGVTCAGHLSGPELASFDEPDAAAAIRPDTIGTAANRLFLLSRAVPDPSERFVGAARSGIVRVGGRAAGWYAAAGDPSPDVAFLATLGDANVDTVSAHEGLLVERIWHLVAGAAAQVERDFGASEPRPARGIPPGVHVLGPGPGGVRLADHVHIEPGVVLDVTAGPIWVEENVSIRAFTRLAGPAWIGRGTTLLGGSFEAVVIGPGCKVRGEVEGSIFLGYSNKAHDGFLGHAYVGRWVNLGALTTNSDLKNNYGSVRLWTPEGEVDTGELKLGCLIGDHVKTGIGVMLNTGTVIGPGCNLYGAAQPPRLVPPFRWGTGENLVPYRFDRFVATAEQAMARRDQRLTPGCRSILEAVAQREAG